jgi:hypothetical protein
LLNYLAAGAGAAAGAVASAATGADAAAGAVASAATGAATGAGAGLLQAAKVKAKTAAIRAERIIIKFLRKSYKKIG